MRNKRSPLQRGVQSRPLRSSNQVHVGVNEYGCVEVHLTAEFSGHMYTDLAELFCRALYAVGVQLEEVGQGMLWQFIDEFDTILTWHKLRDPEKQKAQACLVPELPAFLRDLDDN